MGSHSTTLSLVRFMPKILIHSFISRVESSTEAQGPKKVSLCSESKCKKGEKEMAWPSMPWAKGPDSDPYKEKAEFQWAAPALWRKSKNQEPHPCV